MSRELEVKVLDMNLDLLEDKLKSLGAKLIAVENQKNIIFDTDDRFKGEKYDAYLRIRDKEDILNNTSSTKLTLKKNLSREGISDNLEIDVNIDSVENMQEILKNLGYSVKNIGYKHRKSYKLDEVRFDLDTWDEKTYPKPYMEIELKDKARLNEVIRLLGINENNISTKSIRELREEL